MKPTFLFGLALLVACGRALAQETHPGGIVYGPKAAFKVDAPPGWVLDNSAGVEQGFPCVLYPKASTWADANAIMYAKIASTQYEDVGTFVATAIQQMEKCTANPKRKSIQEKRATDSRISSTNTRPRNRIPSGNASLTSNCPRRSPKLCSRHEMKRAIAKIFPALNEVLKSFAYMKVEGDHKQN
jgi:hypothetical protein